MGPAGAQGQSALPSALAFNPVVGFSVNAFMPRQQVRAVIAFSPSAVSAVVGATVETSLVADGTNVPTFSGFKEWGGSAGYLNTAGTVNYVQLRFDGLDFTYSVVQVINPVAAPQLTAASTTSGQNAITLTYSKALNPTQTPAASAFTLSNSGGPQTVTNVVVSGSTVTLTTSRTVAGSDTIALSYTPPLTIAIASGDGECAGGVSGYAVPVSTGAAPANVAAPVLSGSSAATGSAITVTTGTWSNSPTGYAYQWYYADTSAVIAGATTSSYTPVAADVGHPLKCIVTASNGTGSASASSNASNAVTAPSVPANSVAPALSTTTPVQGAAVSSTTGTWSGSPTGFAYQWFYADTSAAIGGATGSSYVPVAGDVGHTLRCTVTATNATGSASATSNTSGAIVATVAAGFARYTTLNAAMAETANGSGYNYGPSVSANYGGGFGYGVTGTRLPAGTASGWHSAKVGSIPSGDGFMLGFQATPSASGGYSTFKYAMYTSGSTGSWKLVSFGSGGVSAQTNVAFAANDIARLRKDTGNMYAEVSKDGGATWTVIYTWSSITAEDLWGGGLCCVAQEIVQPQTLGFA